MHFEGMELERWHAAHEGFPGSRLPLSAPEVQAALALLVYAYRHEEHGLNYENPRANPESIRRFAMKDWTAEGERSLSARFRAYVEAHPDTQVALTKPDLSLLMDGIDPDWDA